jgi:hypothetical protein
MKRALGAVAIAAAVATATGCGGSEELTRAEFVAQANRACESAAEERPTTATSLIAAVAAGAEQRELVVSRLEQLKPPAEVAARYDELVSLLSRQSTMLADYAELLRADDNASRRLAARMTAEAEDALEIIDQLGLDACR